MVVVAPPSCSSLIFVLGSRHFDQSFAFGGQGFRGDSVGQRCVQSELFHRSYMFWSENALSWAAFATESLDHGWSQSSGSGNRGLGRGSRSGTCLPYFRAPALRQGSLCKGRGLLGELGSSSGAQPVFFLTLKSCIFFGGVVRL